MDKQSNTNHILITSLSKELCIVLIGIIMVVCLTGCREATVVSHNVSKEADEFNIVRRITVINCRTDKVLYQLTGTFSLRNTTTNEIAVVCELPNGTYTKHFIYLNEWTTYTVEDLTGTDVSKYSYELNFLPESIPGVKITNSY